MARLRRRRLWAGGVVPCPQVKCGAVINGRYERITGAPTRKNPRNAPSPDARSHLLGEGTFGKVIYAIDRGVEPSRPVAIKIIKAQPGCWRSDRNHVKREKRLLKRFADHAKGRLLDNFVLKDHHCLVFEFLPLSLHGLLRREGYNGLSLPCVRDIAAQILRGLACLREHNVTHCDLKPDNIMLCEHGAGYRVKIIDFGCSSASSEGPRRESCIQTRFYRAPGGGAAVQPAGPRYRHVEHGVSNAVWRCALSYLAH